VGALLPEESLHFPGRTKITITPMYVARIAAGRTSSTDTVKMTIEEEDSTMARTMYADFSDEAYEAFMRGDAVDNNGLRSRRGNYYPDQPTFRAKPTTKEQLQDIGVDIAGKAGAFIVLRVVCPAIKRFAMEKVYPTLVQKWDAWQERRASKLAELEQHHASPSFRRTDYENDQSSHDGVILDLEKYRKGA